MPLLTVIVVLVLAGLALWAAETFIPMSPPVKTLLRVTVVVMLVVWLLNVFGLLAPLRSIRI